MCFINITGETMYVSDNISNSTNFKSWNVINPISIYSNKYLKKTALTSKKKFKPITEALAGKINQVKLGKISAWDINPENSKEYVLFLHGLGQNVNDYQPLYETILKNKKGVFAVEYRSYGQNEKSKISEDKLKKDAQKAYEYLNEQKSIEPENTIVMGHSMGTALAADLASKHKDIKALVLIAPIKDLANITQKYMENKNVGLGVPHKLCKLKESFNFIKYLFSRCFNLYKTLPKLKMPLFLIQSRDDMVTPLGGARRIAKKARRVGILRDFIVFSSGGHKVDSKKINAVSDILEKEI